MERILHSIAAENEPLINHISQMGQLDYKQASHLLSLGAVFVNKERQRLDIQLRKGDYVRLHREPRRYPTSSIPWKDRILHQDNDFIILNKPSGIPSHPSLDNWKECCKTSLEEVLGYELYGTHRLDLPTEGLLVFAKSKRSQVQFNHLLSSGQVTKLYRALVQRPGPRLGSHIHGMVKSKRSPKQIVNEVDQNSLHCELRILSAETFGSQALLTIELITGRTHQIRAQLAAMDFPILGDITYGGTPVDLDGTKEAIALQAYSIEFSQAEKQESIKVEIAYPDHWSRLKLTTPY